MGYASVAGRNPAIVRVRCPKGRGCRHFLLGWSMTATLSIDTKGKGVMFAARYPGKCWGCETPFFPGELITMVESEGTLNGVPVAQCCADDMDKPERHEELTTPRAGIALVLPRGKTKKDTCKVCFQIPSSSGMCGCS